MRSVGRKLRRLHVSIAEIFLINIVALFRCILTGIRWLLVFSVCDFVVLFFLDWISFGVVPWLHITHFFHQFTNAWRRKSLPYKTGPSRTWLIRGFIFRLQFGRHFWALSGHSSYRAWSPRIYGSLSGSYLVNPTLLLGRFKWQDYQCRLIHSSIFLIDYWILLWFKSVCHRTLIFLHYLTG